MVGLKNVRSSRNWRWYAGGSVIVLGITVGCVSAVKFYSAEKETQAITAQKPKAFTRGLAAAPGDEPAVFGGKLRLPVDVSIDGDKEIVLTQDRVVTFSFTAGSDISSLMVDVTGLDGLENAFSETLEIGEMQAGEVKRVELLVPARSGSISFSFYGRVLVGREQGRELGGVYLIKVINPRQVKIESVKKRPIDMSREPIIDPSGTLIQPMDSAN